MKILGIAFAAVIAVHFATGTAGACDICGCYTPSMAAFPHQAGPFDQLDAGTSGAIGTRFYAAVSEQFTHFGTLQFEGAEIANPTGQFLDSSITQLVGGYRFGSRFALQLNVPLIYRSFERPEGFEIDRGTESGLGDVSLLGRFLAFHHEQGGSASLKFDDPKNPHLEKHEPEFAATALLMAGVKFPTGDTSRLKEEFEEMEIPGAPPSGIHGHDLALGTGSYDGIFAGQTSLRYRNFFFQADAQFALRGSGRHEYDFANDITWSGGPGYYLVRNRSTVIGLQLVVSGEHKELDRFQGAPVEDTGVTSVFLGPRLIASVGKVSAEVGADIPVSIDNSALQIVPDYRIRGGIAFHF